MDGQCTVMINGREVGLKFNRYAIEQAATIKGAVLDGSITSGNLVSIIWGGIKGYAFAKQVDEPLTFEELIDWLDEVQLTGENNKDITTITEAFQSSFLYKHLTAAKEKKEEPAEEVAEEKKSSS